MISTPTDIVHAFYAKLAAADASGALDLMAPDIEWITMWHYRVQGRGPDAVAVGLFGPLMAEWKSLRFDSTEFVEQGETVVSLGVFTAVHGASGKAAEARYAHVWTVQGGKIARFRQYIDTMAIAAARVS